LQFESRLKNPSFSLQNVKHLTLSLLLFLVADLIILFIIFAVSP